MSAIEEGLSVRIPVGDGCPQVFILSPHASSGTLIPSSRVATRLVTVVLQCPKLVPGA